MLSWFPGWRSDRCADFRADGINKWHFCYFFTKNFYGLKIGPILIEIRQFLRPLLIFIIYLFYFLFSTDQLHHKGSWKICYLAAGNQPSKALSIIMYEIKIALVYLGVWRRHFLSILPSWAVREINSRAWLESTISPHSYLWSSILSGLTGW